MCIEEPSFIDGPGHTLQARFEQDGVSVHLRAPPKSGVVYSYAPFFTGAPWCRSPLRDKQTRYQRAALLGFLQGQPHEIRVLADGHLYAVIRG